MQTSDVDDDTVYDGGGGEFTLGLTHSLALLTEWMDGGREEERERERERKKYK